LPPYPCMLHALPMDPTSRRQNQTATHLTNSLSLSISLSLFLLSHSLLFFSLHNSDVSLCVSESYRGELVACIEFALFLFFTILTTILYLPSLSLSLSLFLSFGTTEICLWSGLINTDRQIERTHVVEFKFFFHLWDHERRNKKNGNLLLRETEETNLREIMKTKMKKRWEEVNGLKEYFFDFVCSCFLTLVLFFCNEALQVAFACD
jgi:hypothetical protein